MMYIIIIYIIKNVQIIIIKIKDKTFYNNNIIFIYFLISIIIINSLYIIYIIYINIYTLFHLILINYII